MTRVKMPTVRPEHRRTASRRALDRLEQALELVDAGASVEAAALQVGYYGQAKLSQLCRARLGEWPSRLRGTDWRKRITAIRAQVGSGDGS